MKIEFLTPVGALLGIGAVLALAAFFVAEARARRVSSALRLTPTPRRLLAPLALALAAVPVLLGVAAAQPVLESTHKRYVRSDAEAFFILDTSRSMLASASPSSRTRFERAQSLALDLRRALADVPAGIASLTNRLLPHLFPSAEHRVFAATLERSIGIERPPPNRTASIRVTNFEPLGALQRRNYFRLDAKRRLAIVLTDGETTFLPSTGLRQALRRPPGVHTIFVHVADNDERVFLPSGAPEPAYRADTQSAAKLERLARLVRGETFEEGRLADIAKAARRALGSGARVQRGTERRSRALAPYVALAAFLPLALILRRRNL